MVRYHVFLSFRGPETRDNLVQYLRYRLERLGLEAFLDSEEIKYGDGISSKIMEAIEHSNVCVPIFSQDFATSPACLMEVARMVELKKKILPIFFFVEPCDVRHQLGTYKKSFDDHKSKNRYRESTIKKWEDALKKIPDIKGLEFKSADVKAALRALQAALGEMVCIKGRFYNDLFSGIQELEDFLSKLWDLLTVDEQGVTKNLVGIDRHVLEMMGKLGFDYQDGRVIRKEEITGRMVFVVWGMAGVGKTTLAREVYSKISHLFDGCSFLRDVRRKTMPVEDLQNKLIHDLGGGKLQKVNYSYECIKKIRYHFQKDKVLIVLDDVENSDQIKPLAEEVTWFGSGSIIILISRAKDIITPYEVPENSKPEDLCKRDYEVLCMNESDALELFYKHAFVKPDDLPEGYSCLSKKITDAVERLPLAIINAGNYLRLHGKSKEIWKEALRRFEGNLLEEPKSLFKENYEPLSTSTKEIFLDVACFFNGVKKRNPYYMWDAQRLETNAGIDELQNISFLKFVEENEFWMHNQLQIFGRQTVKENGEDPEERSRLWDYEDVQTTLREKQVTKKVKAIRVPPNHNGDSKFNCFQWKDFLHLPRLRFLDLSHLEVQGNSEDVLPNLVWLDWHKCREKSQLFALNMEKLVILELCSSTVKLSLKDWRKLMTKATHLKVLNAKDCRSIRASLKFPDRVPLERLILEGCSLEIPTDPTSTSGLVNLVTLNIKGCTCIKSLTQPLCSLKKLKELFIDGTKIKKLEFKESSLPSLEILSACECKDLVDVDCITFLKKLQKLALRNCGKLKKLPAVIGELDSLQEMDLSNTLIGELPLSVKKLTYLEVLKMIRTPLNGFPEAIEDLKMLKELDFTNCGSMEGDCNIARLSSLRILKLKGTRILLPRNIAEFRLHILEFDRGDTEQTASEFHFSSDLIVDKMQMILRMS